MSTNVPQKSWFFEIHSNSFKINEAEPLAFALILQAVDVRNEHQIAL